MMTDTMSKNASDLFQIATRIAGFDRGELILEITRRQRGCDRKANETTVLNAMQAIADRHAKADGHCCHLHQCAIDDGRQCLCGHAPCGTYHASEV